MYVFMCCLFFDFIGGYFQIAIFFLFKKYVYSVHRNEIRLKVSEAFFDKNTIHTEHMYIMFHQGVTVSQHVIQVFIISCCHSDICQSCKIRLVNTMFKTVDEHEACMYSYTCVFPQNLHVQNV